MNKETKAYTLYIFFTGICFGYSKKNSTDDEHKQIMLYEIINVLVSLCFYVIITIRVFHNFMYTVAGLVLFFFDQTH